MTYVDFYKENKGNKEMIDTAKLRLVTMTLSEPKYGSDKVVDLDDTDMESLLKDPFIPSLISTFIYKSENDFVNGISFGDYMPIVLCCKKANKFVDGLNLNMIPNELRAVLLDSIDKAYGNYYTGSGLAEAQAGDLAVNNDFGGLLLDENSRLAFFKFFESKTGCSISRAYRRYNISHIQSPRLIEYSCYKYIPILSFDGSIKDANVLKVQQATIAKSDK